MTKNKKYERAFSKASQRRLNTCDDKLKLLAIEVLQIHDCTVVCGTRTKAEQDLAVAQGNSKVEFPNSTHNSFPSRGIDLAPYITGRGLSWDTKQCYFFAGIVVAKAKELGIKIRWGGDWDGDNDVNDQTFNDLVHFELVD